MAEANIRQRIENWTKAFRAKDIDAIMSLYSTVSFHIRSQHHNIWYNLPNKKARTFNVNPRFLFYRSK